MNQRKRILLLGGSGYIGSHLKKALSVHNVIVESPSSSEVSLSEPYTLDRYIDNKQYNYTIYCVINKTRPQFSYNFNNLKNILKFKSQLGCFVLLSSRAVYDSLPSFDLFPPLDIDDIPPPQTNSYSYLKYMEELAVIKEMKDFLIFRLFDTFDDDILNRGPIPIWEKKHKRGKMLCSEEITPIHVDSASEIIAECIVNDYPRGTYNLCSKKIVSSNEVLKRLLVTSNDNIETISHKGVSSFPNYIDSRSWEKFFKF